MSFQRSGLLCCWAVMVFFLWIGAAQAIVIRYEATNLADGDGGEDLWRYSYVVSDHAFNEFEGFTIDFDYALYGALTPLTDDNAHWSILYWDPNPSAFQHGAFDAMALVDAPSLAMVFAVDFIWLGAGSPGTQPFELYFDDGTIFSGITTGTTTPIPEPGTLLMLGSGLAGLACLRKRRSRKLAARKVTIQRKFFKNSKKRLDRVFHEKSKNEVAATLAPV